MAVSADFVSGALWLNECTRGPCKNYAGQIVNADFMTNLNLLMNLNLNMNLNLINTLAADLFTDKLLKCSGSKIWTDEMQRQRPFSTVEDLNSKSDTAWKKLTQDDWLEAFTHHPKIGDVENLRQKFASTANWASNEQSGVNSASEETIKKLSHGNQSYKDKFGYIFIVCATGKSASEMLGLLEQRIDNPPEIEFENACNEQKKITQLRLEKLEP
jgi:2-oxo-4-hydroxy-4-carboxy-5-ureidoimidazoline decarboxylase